jgi:hypothetical protein
MVKLDVRKQLRVLYDSSHEPAMVDVPPMNYLMVDGPETPTARRSTVRPRRRCSASPTL